MGMCREAGGSEDVRESFLEEVTPTLNLKG